jgi:MoaA/NifB/PqqE/SkfB family radical SAM enzyme
MADLKDKIRSLLINYKQAPAMIWRRCNAHMSHRFSNIKGHHASPPETVNFYPTDRCNLKCSMCFERLRKPRPEMQLLDWQMIIDQIKKFRPRIHLSGGEPFSYPHIIDLITLIKKENLFLVITTNGTFLSKHANDIVVSGVNRLHISIDGPEKIHDRIRGVSGTFNTIMEGLKKIKNLRGEGHLPVIRINSMLNLSNPAAMQEVINIACDIDANSVQFQHPLFVDEQSLTAHRFFLKKNLKLDLNYWQNANIDITEPEDYATASQIIRNLQNEHSTNVTVFPKISEADLEAYYSTANNFYQAYHGTCRAMWNTATILPSGDMESCPDYILGNCQNDNFLSIWNNDTMKRLRQRIHSRYFFTVCRGCCFFYS